MNEVYTDNATTSVAMDEVAPVVEAVTAPTEGATEGEEVEIFVQTEEPGDEVTWTDEQVLTTL